jgi:hypothetical protein
MNQEQAAEIHRHLLRAANAIRRAEHIMWDLPQQDPAAFAEPLGKTVVALHFELTEVIYRRFPDLKPPVKGWRRIDSKLTWKGAIATFGYSDGFRQSYCLGYEPTNGARPPGSSAMYRNITQALA